MRRSVQRQFLCALFVIFALSLSCSSPPPKPPKAKKTVAFITNNFSDFWKVAQKGCAKAGAELPDVTVDFKPNYDGTLDYQNRLVRDALDKDDADAIAISPVDPNGQKNMINGWAKRALVITQDSDAPDTNRALYIGTDNREAGHEAGELIKKALPQGGKIMVFVGKREAQNAQERYDGLKDSLQGSNVTIIDLMTDDNDPGQARDNAFQTVKKYPDIAGMVGLWAYNGPAIVQALKLQDKAGKVKVVCFDDVKETLDAIKDGTIYATVAQQPYEYGKQAIQTAEKYLKGDKSVVPESKKILIPTVVIERNNVDEYRKKMSQLLGSTSG